MKIRKKELGYIILTFFLCFTIYQNWDKGSHIIATLWASLKPFLYGAGIAYVINIVMYAYEKWLVILLPFKPIVKLKRPIAMVLSYLTFMVIIVWIFSIVIPDLIASLQLLLRIDTQAISKIIADLNDNDIVNHALDLFGENADLSATISKYTQQILQQLLGFLTNILTSVSSIASTILNVFISLVFSIYVLANKEQLIRQTHALVTVYAGKWANYLFYLTDILHNRFHNFFVGQTLEAVILGSLTAVGMLLFGFPYAATVGVLVAFTALIPVVGAYIGATVGFILIATESFTQALLFLLFLVILQQLEGNIIYPKVVGNSIGLPGMWVLLVITLGGAIGGIFGMILGVPVAGTIYQVIKDDVQKRQPD
ncbi:AI-2E family transporter [Streptococcus hyovaginalis]